MGYCQVGGTTQPCPQEDCQQLGGSYKEKPQDFPGGCFLLSILGDERAMLMVATQMYPSMISFRDEILRRTPIGRRFVSYFDTFYEEAKSIARNDPELVTEIVWLTTYISPFIEAMLGRTPPTEAPGETPLTLLASELRPPTHRAILSVVEKFTARGSAEFVTALNDFEHTLSGFVGLSPSDALHRLRRGGT